MDIATIIGMTLGAGLIIGSIMMGGDLVNYWSAAGLMVVIGGTVAAVFVASPVKEIKLGLLAVKEVFFSKPFQPMAIVDALVEIAEVARREGLLVLEDKAEETEDPFLKKGLQILIDSNDYKLLKDILEIELAYFEERNRVGQTLFEQMGAYAPAFGMIGTLIGLIQMLRDLDNPEQIGAGMALALLTTFYGALIANLFFLPMAGKLKVRNAREILQKEMIIEGILAVQKGENPRLIRDKLESFLSADERVVPSGTEDEQEEFEEAAADA